jgi:AcrR family transcriptional regulator
VVGRPRSTECDHAILDAALAEYATRGLEGMSVDAVAARAGVSKATIYRRYPSKVELVVAAAFVIAEETAPTVDTGVLRDDLLVSLRNLARILSDPLLGAAKRMMISDAARNEDLARLQRESVHERRARMLHVLRSAVDRGELRDDIDVEFAADTLGAPLFYRHLVMNERVTNEYIDRVIDEFLARYAVRQDVGVPPIG